MREAEIECVLEKLYEELHLFIETVHEIPYLALPSQCQEIICFSEKIKELSGYDADEIISGKEHWSHLIHPDDRHKVFAAYVNCKYYGISFNVEYRIVRRNGSLCSVKDKGEPVFDDQGNIIYIEGAIIPVIRSEKKKKAEIADMRKRDMQRSSSELIRN